MKQGIAIHLPGLVKPHDLAHDRQFSMNLARGLEVLRAFTAQSPVLGNREIADRTSLPKPTVSRLTYTLMLMGFLSARGQQKYTLGPGVLSLGHPLMATLQIRQFAKPVMERLSRLTGGTVNLGMRDRASVVYIETIRPDSVNVHLPDIGTTRPLIASAMGRALIFSSPAAEQTGIFNYLKLHDAQAWEKHAAALARNRELFFQYGYCASMGDWRKEVHAVAVPIRRPAGNDPIAMNCTLYAQASVDEKLTRDVVPLLKEAARELEGMQAPGLR